MVLIKIIKFFFLIILFNCFFFNKVLSECLSKNNLKVGIIENEFIDYRYYLLYTLGNYAIDREIEFEVDIVNKNIEEFDIIFGEHYDLNKLTKNKIKFPKEIRLFYEENDIKLKNNILPLDLDTFILLSKKRDNNIYFEELANTSDPFNYTLGTSFHPKENFIKLFLYSLGEELINNRSVNFDSKIDLFKKTFKNQNKNILRSNYYEIYDSYLSEESLFTLFGDGILLYEDIKYKSFKLFPQSKYIWNEHKGFFIKRKEIEPISFYGFSAYINNTNHIGYLCYLVNEEVRINTFKKFNVNLSPLSIKELDSIKNEISNNYKNILENKTKNIYELSNENIKNYNLLIDLIKNKYVEKINEINYLDLE